MQFPEYRCHVRDPWLQLSSVQQHSELFVTDRVHLQLVHRVNWCRSLVWSLHNLNGWKQHSTQSLNHIYIHIHSEWYITSSTVNKLVIFCTPSLLVYLRIYVYNFTVIFYSAKNKIFLYFILDYDIYKIYFQCSIPHDDDFMKCNIHVKWIVWLYTN